MSLKAYDGLMTRKGIKYIQDETIKRMDSFRELSENKLCEKYAEMVIQRVDEGFSAESLIRFNSFGGDNDTARKIKEIDTNNIPLTSLMFQLAKIMSNSYFQNDFTVSLHLTIEAIKGKTLIYPSLAVHEHKKILLEYLEDYYAQNQCDSPDDVPTREWKRRCKEWYAFSEVRGFKLKIVLFDPNSYESIVEELRGDRFFEGIMKYIPSDEKRIKEIAVKQLLKTEFKDNPDECKDDKMKRVWEYMAREKYYLKDEEGMKILNQYILDQNISVTPITKELLKEPIIKNNPIQVVTVPKS